MVSPRKTSSTLGLIPEERYRAMPSDTTKSCESLYSNTGSASSKSSAKAVYRRKNPSMIGLMVAQHNNRQSSLIPASTEVRQRVLSARRLRMKTYQNQLTDAQQTIAELAHENRILRTLHKRQDTALAKYESTNAELPKLLHSHAEELRMWQTKYRNLQTITKDLEQKLKQKESIILTLTDQNKYYRQLNKDKNLEERQRLTEKVHTLETRLQEKDDDMKVLARKMQIETKNFKQQLISEQKRTKEALLKLETTRLELSGYRKLDELNIHEKISPGPRRKPKVEESKLEKDLEKILEKDADSSSQLTTTRDTNVHEDSHRSSQNASVSKLEICTTRTIRKMAVNPRVAGGQHTFQLPISQRRQEKGDGDASILTDMKSASARQQLQQPSKKIRETDKKSKHSVGNRSYGEDISYGEAASYTVIKCEDTDGRYSADAIANADVVTTDDNDADCVVEETVEKYHDDDNEDDDEDVAAQYSEEVDEFEEEQEEDDADADVIVKTAKQSTRMREDISNIRKQISDDFKEREAFLDTFCRQATNGVLLEEPPKRHNNANAAATVGRSTPSSRKNKLLAVLKAIDDNKSQD